MPLWAASMHVCVPFAFGGTLHRQKDDQEAKATQLQDSDCQSRAECVVHLWILNLTFKIFYNLN